VLDWMRSERELSTVSSLSSTQGRLLLDYVAAAVVLD
jgi:hypothetical protein